MLVPARTAKYGFFAAIARRLWSVLPAGGLLPAEIWNKRHRFLVRFTWFHAVVIAFVGPVAGYSWELSLSSPFHDGTVLHTLTEGLVVAAFAVLASRQGASRAVRASLVGFGLISSSAILVHLSGGYIELHFHFFVMLVFLALYQDWIPYGLAVLYVAIHHGVVGVLWPSDVYNHPAAINAPWTWAGIHAFFVLCSSVGSIIAWRFNEKAYAQNAQLYEQIIQQAVELKRASKVKDEFLSVMSHELRTPLNLVLGYAGTMKDGIFGDINPDQEKALEKVLSHGNSLLSMISSILYATNIEANEIQTDSHRCALGDFLGELKAIFDMREEQQLSLIWDYPSDLPVVQTDREKLKQILQNLIRNAIKFTESGHVTISARIKECTQPEKDKALASGGKEKVIEFKVADTGSGIPPEKLPIIFELFRQADSSETRRHEGVGLGLYIAKHFTELLGGTIQVETAANEGSTFTVSIPCAVCPSRTSETKENEAVDDLKGQEPIHVSTSASNPQHKGLEER